MNGKERVKTTLSLQEPDRVPTGENDMDYVLVEQLLGRETLYNSRWKEKEALWDGRRDEIVADYGTTLVDLARALDWDYVRVPTMPPAGEYARPIMTGPYSWLDDQGREIHYSPAVGNIATRVDNSEMTIDQLPDPDALFEVDPSELEAVRHVVGKLGESRFIIGRLPIDGTFPYQETVGMQEFLVRMITEPAFVHRAIDAYVGRSIAYINALFDAGVRRGHDHRRLLRQPGSLHGAGTLPGVHPARHCAPGRGRA